MRYVFLLLLVGGCGYIDAGIVTAGSVFYFLEDDPNTVYHCWIDRSQDRPERWCEKEEGF